MAALRLIGIEKSFTLHLQDGASIPVFDNVELDVDPGECRQVDTPETHLRQLSRPWWQGANRSFRMLYRSR